jgi:hypothetical protein
LLAAPAKIKSLLTPMLQLRSSNNTQYKKMYARLVTWADQDPDLNVEYEVTKLGQVFREKFSYDTEILKIPSGWSDNDSEKALRDMINEFVALGDNSNKDLKILVYAGHGFLNPDRLPAWCR